MIKWRWFEAKKEQKRQTVRIPCSSPSHQPWARRWINHCCLCVTHGQCDARPTVALPPARHHRSLAGTKLYCLVTEAHVWEQLAQGCTRECGACWSQVQRLNHYHYATKNVALAAVNGALNSFTTNASWRTLYCRRGGYFPTTCISRYTFVVGRWLPPNITLNYV